jgi:TP901 family phage tail tape measure protein
MAASADGTVNIIVNAKDNTKGVFGNVSKQFGKIGTAAVAGVAGGVAIAGAAIAGVAIKGVSEFIKFEDQMNEVFTLLPNISGEAMSQMRDQVLDVSEEMGRLPEDIVPALYQSISAGVPKDNVFEFLEQAHKASLGGVTDLETAVDGITSVMNAYGSDVVSAANASDVMFTAVRLGKTDFQQLSRSLFNVIPTAASLGVSFEDVSASLAVLTGQGTPTRVATTQIRSALVEASKGGTKLDEAIKEMTGSSFPELIQQGTSMPGIFEALRNSMPDQQFKDLFGSVEAVNAVLGITGPNFDKTVSAMEEMQDSAGATDAAYERMNSGMARTLEVLQAKFKTTFIRIGDALSPLVTFLGDALLRAFENLEPLLEDIQTIIMKVGGAFEGFFKNLEGGMHPLEALKNLISNLLINVFGVGVEKALAFQEAFDQIREKVTLVVDKIREFAEPILEAIGQFVSWKDILIVLGGVISGVILVLIAKIAIALAPILLIIAAVIAVVALLRNAWENNWGGIQEKVAAVIGFITKVITFYVDWIKAFWAEHGDTIMAKAAEIWEGIQLAVSTALEFIGNLVETVITWIQEFWAEHGETIIAIVTNYFELVRGIIETVFGVIEGIFDAFALAFEGDWRGFGEKLREVWDGVWEKIKEAIETAVPIILATMAELVLKLIKAIKDVDWRQMGKDIVTGIARGITSAAGKIRDAAMRAARAAWEAVKGFFGLSSPSKLMMEAGVNVSEGLAIGIEKELTSIKNSLERSFATVIPTPEIPAVQGANASSFVSGEPRESRRVQEFHLHIHGTETSAKELIEEFETMKSLVVE